MIKFENCSFKFDILSSFFSISFSKVKDFSLNSEYLFETSSLSNINFFLKLVLLLIELFNSSVLIFNLALSCSINSISDKLFFSCNSDSINSVSFSLSLPSLEFLFSNNIFFELSRIFISLSIESKLFITIISFFSNSKIRFFISFISKLYLLISSSIRILFSL